MSLRSSGLPKIVRPQLDRLAVWSAVGGMVPGVTVAMQRIGGGDALGRDKLFQRCQPVAIIGLAGVGVALRLGADEVVLSRDANEMARHVGSFDVILDAVSANHDINAYINLLARDGNLTLVGAPDKPLAVSAFGLIMGRRSLSGSPIGGIRSDST